jgi:hypothetical protein
MLRNQMEHIVDLFFKMQSVFHFTTDILFFLFKILNTDHVLEIKPKNKDFLTF